MRAITTRVQQLQAGGRAKEQQIHQLQNELATKIVILPVCGSHKTTM